MKRRPRIVIVMYMAKFGSFANHESVMYRAVLEGANGKRQTLPDTERCCTEYEGHPERKYADRIAGIWAKLLGVSKIGFSDEIAKAA